MSCLSLSVISKIVRKRLNVKFSALMGNNPQMTELDFGLNTIQLNATKGNERQFELSTSNSATFSISALKLEVCFYCPCAFVLMTTNINVKNCSLSTTYNGEMTHPKQQK